MDQKTPKVYLKAYNNESTIVFKIICSIFVDAAIYLEGCEIS